VAASFPRQHDSVLWQWLAECSNGGDHHNRAIGRDLVRWRHNNSGAAFWIPPRLIFEIHPDDAALSKHYALRMAARLLLQTTRQAADVFPQFFSAFRS
jgi:hypothetical protein